MDAPLPYRFWQCYDTENVDPTTAAIRGVSQLPFSQAITNLVMLLGRFAMKDAIHPKYNEVIFQDASCGFTFKTRSTVKTNQTITWEDGKVYPLVVVDVSSASHPFYTGKTKFVDAAGRVDKFNKKFSGTYGKKKDPEPAQS